MPRAKSGFLGGWGHMDGFVHGLVDAVLAAGGDDSVFERFRLDPGLMRGLAKTMALEMDSFSLEINYDLGFQRWVDAGKYDVVDGVSEEEFPSWRKGVYRVHLQIIPGEGSFAECMDRIKYEYHCSKSGIIELLAVGAAFPDLQRFNMLVAPGSLHGDVVPALDCRQKQRMLWRVGVPDNGAHWCEGVRMLGVKSFEAIM